MKAIAFLILFITSAGIAITHRVGSLEPEPEVLPASIIRTNEYPKTLSELTATITKLISTKEGMYSVVFDDFNSTDKININEEDVVTAASVIKIPILAAVYSLADDGKIDLDEKITILSDHVQDWGTGTIRYESPPIVHTIREICQLLIEKSDNTAAYVLVHDVIGEDQMKEILDTWGLTQTDIAENITSNQDMVRLMRMIFNDEIAATALTKEMIGWMDDSDFENRLPGLLPEEVNVYHKIGNEIQVIHDVGVIAFEGNSYYLGVLTSGITDIEDTENTIAELSNIVYHYMLQKGKKVEPN